MENQPQNIIAIGRKRFPIEEIALVEPFEPPAEQPPRFTSDKDFKARVVLIDRYNVLTEDTVEAFAEANKFRRLPDDNVATNPAVRFEVRREKGSGAGSLSTGRGVFAPWRDARHRPRSATGSRGVCGGA